MDTIEPEYQKTLDYIYTFVDFSLQRNFQVSPEKFDLTRMHRLMELLGNPHQRYPIIHIAGTKGKGSVAALCASALAAAGYQVGLYTSPHLEDYTERIQINGEKIPHLELVRLVEEIRPQIEAVPEITTFEITTGLAFYYFAQQKVGAAVIEVGLGGRLDATNIVDPLVSVITSLSLDHTALLGNTLVEIAGEKAGIIKPGKPVVLSPQKDEARQAVLRIAEERSAPLIEVGKDYLFSPLSHSIEGQSLQVWQKPEPGTPYPANTQPVRLFIPLLGIHQVENAAAAYAALKTAQAAGLQIDEASIQKGFEQVVWPGRFELIQRNPFVIVDSAHNQYSANRLTQTLKDYFPGYPVVLVYGASEDKDIQGMLAELLPQTEKTIFTRSIHPRAADPAMLVEMAQKQGHAAQAAGTIEQALADALKIVPPNGLVLVTGSIFIAAGARQALEKAK